MDDNYIHRAWEEILNPSLEITKQHVGVHSVKTHNGKPKVSRISELKDGILVYFEVEDERFFFVVKLESTTLSPSHFFVESGHRVYLSATSESHDFSDLKRTLNLEPVVGWSKGEKRPNGKSEYSFSRISFEPNKIESYSLEEKLSELLILLLPYQKEIEELSQISEPYISVCRHQYVSANSGMHLDSKQISALNKLNLELDIDSYIVGEEHLD